METITNPDWLATIEWYRTKWSNGPKGSEGIDGLLSLVEHNRMHFSKMIASLIPVLNMLTSGELGDLLSPNEEDSSDRRPILDTSTIISGKHVLYVGLDSLSDSIVSSAIGSIVLADFASVAGMIYNSGIKPGRISMFVDEAAEVVNLPFIQILNKGRGAGFQVVMATQTLPDIVARLGVPFYTVFQNPYKIGKASSDLLISIIESGKSYEHFQDVIIDFEVVQR
jgi:conjugal transfer pilus assembly protein TraD